MNSIQNPILRGFNPDPSICRVGDEFFVATSTFEWYPGVQIHKSTDLSNWTFVDHALKDARLLDMKGVPDSCGVWAPCLTYSDGLFWLCYTVVTRFDGEFKDTHNYLTWSDRIDGEWADPVYMNSSGFDPSLFHDDDGRKWFSYMIWDHRPDRSYFRGIELQEYDPEAKRLVGPTKIVFDGTETDFTEGPHYYKRGDWYYLMTAEGGTGYGHAVTMVRSKSIWGPFEEDPELHVMTARDKPGKALQRTGHASIAEGPDGRWWMAHLCSRPIGDTQRSPLGRESALQEVYWTDDGWLRLCEPEQAYDAGDHEPQEISYSFDTEKLSPDFQWLRVPQSSELFSLTEKADALRLHGRDSLGSFFYSSLVARRQQAISYEAETEIAYAPTNFQHSAGLVAYYNAHKFHYLHMTHDDDRGAVLQIMSCEGDQSLKATFPIWENPIELGDLRRLWLRVVVQKTELQFWWSADHETWEKVGGPLDATILSDEAGKGEGASFTGAFVGMACQDLTGRRTPADFYVFNYREIAE